MTMTKKDLEAKIENLTNRADGLTGEIEGTCGDTPAGQFKRAWLSEKSARLARELADLQSDLDEQNGEPQYWLSRQL